HRDFRLYGNLASKGYRERKRVHCRTRNPLRASRFVGTASDFGPKVDIETEHFCPTASGSDFEWPPGRRGLRVGTASKNVVPSHVATCFAKLDYWAFVSGRSSVRVRLAAPISFRFGLGGLMERISTCLRWLLACACLTSASSPMAATITVNSNLDVGTVS